MRNVFEKCSKKISDESDADWLREFESIDNSIHKIRKNFKRHYNIPDEIKDSKSKPSSTKEIKESKPQPKPKLVKEEKERQPKPEIKPEPIPQQKPRKPEPTPQQAPPKPLPAPQINKEDHPPTKVKQEKTSNQISTETLRLIYQKFVDAAETDEELYDRAETIIREGEGINDDDELELDIEKLNIRTLRELQKLFQI